MSSEITDLSGRVRTFSSRGASPALLFDDGTATPVRRSIDTKARTGRTVAWLSERLGAVPPEVARDWAEAASVFVAPEPVAYGDRESALAAVTANVAGRLSELTYTYQLGTVGDGAALMLQRNLDELLISQYVFVVDTSGQLHEFYFWSR